VHEVEEVKEQRARVSNEGRKKDLGPSFDPTEVMKKRRKMHGEYFAEVRVRTNELKCI